MAEQPNVFLKRHKEKEEMNQYWYSPKSIATLVEEIEEIAAEHGCAFVSTPSLYFSLKSADVKAKSRVLDWDREFAADPGYVFYDFNEPEAICDDCRGRFDAVVIDPPFITREVWEKYARTAKLLVRKGGKLILTTIAENAPMMKELLDADPCAWKPSIPHLVYQYNAYTNYASKRLSAPNPEIPE
eukprot:tig00000663_g2959.t1